MEEWGIPCVWCKAPEGEPCTAFQQPLPGTVHATRTIRWTAVKEDRDRIRKRISHAKGSISRQRALQLIDPEGGQ